MVRSSLVVVVRPNLVNQDSAVDLSVLAAASADVVNAVLSASVGGHLELLAVAVC